MTDKSWDVGPDAARWPPTDRWAQLTVTLTPDLTAFQAALTRAGEALKRATETIPAFGIAYQAPLTGVRERALWLQQHRNTGPERKPPWLT